MSFVKIPSHIHPRVLQIFLNEVYDLLHAMSVPFGSSVLGIPVDCPGGSSVEPMIGEKGGLFSCRNFPIVVSKLRKKAQIVSAVLVVVDKIL